MPSPAEHPTSEFMPPAQVLEIRSPERRGGPDDCNGAAPSHQPWQPAARARLRFDPRPVAPPEVDEGFRRSLPMSQRNRLVIRPLWAPQKRRRNLHAASRGRGRLYPSIDRWIAPSNFGRSCAHKQATR